MDRRGANVPHSEATTIPASTDPPVPLIIIGEQHSDTPVWWLKRKRRKKYIFKKKVLLRLNMKCRRTILIPLGLAALTLLTRSGFYITTPLWLDSLSPGNSHSTNSSKIITNFSDATKMGKYAYESQNHIKTCPLPHTAFIGSYIKIDSEGGVSRNVSLHVISPYFVMIAQWGTATIMLGGVLIVIMVLFPWALTPEDWKYPKTQILITGSAQGISSILVTYALSGSRTPPYLQAILANFGVPIQFIIRFLILHKRPTLFKLCCAVAVLVAEFICLIPTMFPQLESSAQRQKDGGATGAGRVLFPLSCVLSLVPFAIANSILEKGVHSHSNEGNIQIETGPRGPPSSSRPQSRSNKVNLVYFLFWWCLFNTLTLFLFFWVDIIPGFGTSKGILSFFEKMKFDSMCFVGQAGCGAAVVGLAWANCAFIAFGTLVFTAFMRYSEGANFVVIVLSLRTPLLFLFWTLFSEKPFAWSPHVALSTWLSFGGLAIMLPAIILYNVGAPEVSHKSPSDHKGLLADTDGEENNIPGIENNIWSTENNTQGTDPQQGTGSFGQHQRNLQ